MNTYIAKKANIQTMKECQAKGCSSFTTKGYYIQCRKANVDNMLFVCDDCFHKQYSSKCTFGTFDENEYLSIDFNRRYRKGTTSQRKFFKVFNKSVRFLRIACIIAVLLISILYIAESIENESDYIFSVEKIEINAKVRNIDNISGQIKRIIDRIEHAFTIGGKKNDK